MATRTCMISDEQLLMLARCAEASLKGHGLNFTDEDRYELGLLVGAMRSAALGPEEEAEKAVYGLCL